MTQIESPLSQSQSQRGFLIILVFGYIFSTAALRAAALQAVEDDSSFASSTFSTEVRRPTLDLTDGDADSLQVFWNE